MPRDYVEEMALIEMSKLQRKAWEFSLLLTAGLPLDEAEQIADLAAADRSEAAHIDFVLRVA